MQASEVNQLPEIDELICRLELALVEPDPDYDLDESDSAKNSPDPADSPDTTSGYGSSTSSPTSSTQLAFPTTSGNEQRKTENRESNGRGSAIIPVPVSGSASSVMLSLSQREVSQHSQQPPSETDDKRSSSRFDFIKKLRNSTTDLSSHSKKSNRRKTLERLKVDSLPQSFVAKYVGCKACRGLWGIQYTREPVDALVDDLRRIDRTADRQDDLPLVNVNVNHDGIAIAAHSRNRSRRPISDVGLLPLEFISYAVQDTRYSRIFAFILVRELSSRARATECHAFLCDAPTTARTLALSVSLAFRTYEQKLAGRQFKFVVDLRWPDELEPELAEGKIVGSKKSLPRAEFEV